MLGRAPDADHDLGAGDDRGDEFAPAASALLGKRKRGGQQRRAGMHAGTRPGQIVHLEGMCERAVGQGRRGGMHAPRAASENAALTAGAVLFGKGHDHSAPRQVVAEDDRGNRVRDALLGAFDDVGREVLVTTRRGVLGEFRSLFRHGEYWLWCEWGDRVGAS